MLDTRDWIQAAEQYAVDVYGITLSDLGFDFNDASVMLEESPDGWVERQASKYGLIDITERW